MNLVAEVGSALNVLGLMITIIALIREHRDKAFGDLEPWLAARWRSVTSRIRRVLGRGRDSASVHAGSAQARHRWIEWDVEVWRTMRPEDGVDPTIDALVHNVEELREAVGRLRRESRLGTRELERKLMGQFTTAEQRRLDERTRERDVTIQAMRWEWRGLAIALLGALMSLLG